MTRRPAATLVALFLAALTLRPQIVGVGPLIPEIQDAFDTSHALVGLLGTIPVLCMGLFAPVAAYLAARVGTRRAMTLGLALIGCFGVLRAVMPSAWLVVLLTWPVGIGMGLGTLGRLALLQGDLTQAQRLFHEVVTLSLIHISEPTRP